MYIVQCTQAFENCGNSKSAGGSSYHQLRASLALSPRPLSSHGGSSRVERGGARAQTPTHTRRQHLPKAGRKGGEAVLILGDRSSRCQLDRCVRLIVKPDRQPSRNTMSKERSDQVLGQFVVRMLQRGVCCPDAVVRVLLSGYCFPDTSVRVLVVRILLSRECFQDAVIQRVLSGCYCPDAGVQILLSGYCCPDTVVRMPGSLLSLAYLVE